MEEIDKRINEARNKPLTAENLNYIGDLYLRKGDKNQAIDYFYDAVAKLPFVQKEKKIAIYKKIIKNSPSDNRAYEGIINIFSKMGLFVEEIRFLIMLAKLYQEKREYNKVNSIFRRIKEIDPQNIIAEKYFQKGKQFPEERDVYETDITKEKVETEDINHVTTMKNIKEKETEEILDKEDIRSEEREIVYKVRDRADAGLFTVTLEESDIGKKPFYIHEIKKTYKRVYIYAGVSVLLIVVGVVLFMLKGKSKDDTVIVRGIEKDKIEKIWINNIIELKTSNYEFSVTRISDELMNESGILRVINQNDVQKKQFYSVSVKAIRGCLPDEFISSPQEMMSFIEKDGFLKNIEEIKGLNNLNKIIYKSNSCDREFGVVFMRIFVHHNKDLHYTGLSIKGLERDYPATIKWE